MPDRQKASVPGLALTWAHLAVLWSFAFAKPLLDVLADSPDFFVARGNTAGDIVLLACVLVLLPPSLLVLAEALLIRLPRARGVLHLGLVALLTAAFVLQLLGDLGGTSATPLIAASLVAGAAGALAYALVPAAATVLTVLSPAPLVILALFLLVSPVSDLVLPKDEAGAATANGASRVPVVFLLFDEFDGTTLMDAGREVDRSRYPHFAALAAHGTWYRNATTVADRTLRAVPAVLSGRRPPLDALPLVTDYPGTVFSLLGGSHSMRVTETVTQLCPEKLCGKRSRDETEARLRSLASDLSVVSLHLLLPRDLRSDLPNVDQTFGGFRGGGDDARDATARDATASDATASDASEAPGLSGFSANRPQTFGRFLRSIGAERDRPPFHFLHFALPHAPWQYLPDGRQYPLSGPEFPGLNFDTWGRQEPPVRLSLQRHLLQTGYADHLLGELLSRLRESGLYDRALVIVTADHGVSYRPGGHRRTTTRSDVSDIASVPLFVKYPSQREGRIEDRMARTIDIVPTIARAVRSPLPWRAEGRPLQAAAAPRDPRVRIAVNSTDDYVSISFSDFRRRREAGRRRIAALFGPGRGWAGIFAAGAPAGLIGRPAGAFTSTEGSPAQFRLDSPDLFAAVKPDGHSVPSLVTGVVTGPVEDNTPMAIAIDGRVQAVASTFRDGDTMRLQAMVAPGAFARGSNPVTAYLLGPGRSLTPLRSERLVSYRLERRAGRIVVIGGGRELPVGGSTLKGYVEGVERQGGSFVVHGWAADPRSGHPATSVLVFSGDRFLAEVRPKTRRPDLPRPRDAAAPLAGFRAGPLAKTAGAERVRVFAVRDGRAVELPRL